MNKLSDSYFSESVEQQFISILSQSEYEGKWMRLIRKNVASNPDVQGNCSCFGLVWYPVPMLFTGILGFQKTKVGKKNKKKMILIYHTADILLYKPAPPGYTAPFLSVDQST
ncbi:hypothetical protein T06_7606 [Trichinella sp. T6]|nr:hypothetical protein T06_7606 [Trichinella sp. T6]